MSRMLLRSRRLRYVSHGFTLVELLVVIAIIGILVALLLPAVQAAREAARRAQCQNHLKQIGVAFLLHENVHKFLPAAGISPWHVGDPLRGASYKQPGGWMFNILPFIEEQSLYDLTDDGDSKITPLQKQLSVRLQETPVSIFNCPTRRAAAARVYQLPASWQPINSDPMSQVVRSDYAANGGDGEGGMRFPKYDSNGDVAGYEYLLPPIGYAIIDHPLTKWPSEKDQSGINFLGAEISVNEVVDGMSKVYMVGEKYLNPDLYESAGDGDGGDNHSCYQGFDWDINRWATEEWPPQQDTPGFNGYEGFGSAHPGVWHAVMCDGAVISVPYEIDVVVHMRLANRFDGEVIAESP